MARKIFVDIAELFTLEGAAQKHSRHVRESDLGRIPKAAMVVNEGRIDWVGPKRKLPRGLKGTEISLDQRTVIPGLIDCHTHTVFAGNRSDEFDRRCRGETYQQIAECGGGIQKTVAMTRKASLQHLIKLGQTRADDFVAQGVTTLEVKSGYGLDVATEIKVIRAAQQLTGPRIVTTYLGLHAIPKESQSSDAYVDSAMEALPAVLKKTSARRVDVFIEKGYFSIAQAQRFLTAAAQRGFHLVVHAEQLTRCGSIELLKTNQIQSFDHLVHLNSHDISALAKSSATCVLLPSSEFYLHLPMPPARALIDAGARVALASDFNPGSSPTQDLSFIGYLARQEMKMSLPETIAAFTTGAAFALGLESEVGALMAGRFADFAVLKGERTDLFYQVGHRPMSSVWRNGRQIWRE